MWLAWCKLIGVPLLVGFIVKLMDDYLDYEENSPVFSYLGHGLLPYSLLLLLFAVAIDFAQASALFLAAYSVGMVGRGQHAQLPTGLTPQIECLAVIMVGVYLSDWRTMFAALAALVAVQALDDLIDYPKDCMLGIQSWCTRHGPVVTGLVLTIALGIGLLLELRQVLTVILVSRLISELFDRQWKQGEGRMDR